MKLPILISPAGLAFPQRHLVAVDRRDSLHQRLILLIYRKQNQKLKKYREQNSAAGRAAPTEKGEFSSIEQSLEKGQTAASLSDFQKQNADLDKPFDLLWRPPQSLKETVSPSAYSPSENAGGRGEFSALREDQRVQARSNLPQAKLEVKNRFYL